MFYYLEIDCFGKIQSYGNTTDINIALKNSSDGNSVLEITEFEYNLISACNGDIRKGINKLKNIQHKITQNISDNLDNMEIKEFHYGEDAARIRSEHPGNEKDCRLCW